MILNFVDDTLQGKKNVIDFLLPDQLSKEIDFKIGDDPVPQEQLIPLC